MHFSFKKIFAIFIVALILGIIAVIVINRRHQVVIVTIPKFVHNPVTTTSTPDSKSEILNPLWLGIKTDQKTLYKKIDARLHQRLKQGMIAEVQKLHLAAPSPLLRGDVANASERQRGGKKGLSWRRLKSFGLEYKYISLFLQNKIS